MAAQRPAGGRGETTQATTRLEQSEIQKVLSTVCSRRLSTVFGIIMQCRPLVDQFQGICLRTLEF